MPISMWKPWNEKEHYPFDFTQLARTIKTPVGEAAYLICFEELLVWRLPPGWWRVSLNSHFGVESVVHQRLHG